MIQFVTSYVTAWQYNPQTRFPTNPVKEIFWWIISVESIEADFSPRRFQMCFMFRIND